MADTGEALTIQEVAARTGVSEATLRAWEQRHGFPTPDRDGRGRRRYRAEDCARVLEVVALRSTGLSLAAAIERAVGAEIERPISIQAEVRRMAPVLAPHALGMGTLLDMSRAVEDECSASADRPVLVGAFQTATAFRKVESRWRHLAGAASCTLVLGTFDRRRRTDEGLVEVPFAVDARIRDEWAVLVHSPTLTVGLVAWERPGPHPNGRTYEALWTVDRGVVARAIEIALDVGDVVESDRSAVRRGLARPATAGRSETGDAIGIANRMVAYVAGSPDTGR